MKARKLPSGNYNVVIPYYDNYGKRKQKSFTAEEEAQAIKKAQDFLDGYECLYDETITLKKAFSLYIETRKNVLEESTIKNYKQLSRFCFNSIKNMRLCDLKPIDIQRAVSIESGRVSPKYTKNAYGLLKSVLKMFAVNINLSSIRLPKLTKKQKKLPEFETVYRIFKGTSIELPVLLASWLSLRIGEVLGLQFRDVDFTNKTLFVRRTIIATEEGPKVRNGCKTEKSTRILRLHDFLLEQIKNIPHKSEEDFIIPLTYKALSNRFKRIVIKHGMDISFHDLRHLSASTMLMLGVADKYAMERGGWSTDYILKSVYQQTFESERERVDNKIDDYFSTIISNVTVEQGKVIC